MVTRAYIGATITKVSESEILFVGTQDTVILKGERWNEKSIDSIIVNASDNPWDFNDIKSMNRPC